MNDPDRVRAIEALAARIDSQAAISSRPGQLDELEQIAREVRALAGVPAPEVADLEDRYGETYVWHQFPGCQPGYHQCVDGESIDYIERERGGKLRPAPLTRLTESKTG